MRLNAAVAKLRTVAASLRHLPEHLQALDRARLNQAVIAMRIARTAQPTPDDPWQSRPSSCLCTEARCASPTYVDWCHRLALEPTFNRKSWEYAYAAAVLDVCGALVDGRRGVGFGVGREPLPAYFAARGCTVIATDQPAASVDASRWARSGQYAGGLEGLQRPELCDPEQFMRRVTFRPVDMNAVPQDLTGFDFCWSLCALEHLGSLDAGLRFVERSLECLRPGGIAVHTLELNVSSDDKTLMTGPTVLYRRQDITAFAARLESQGHVVAPLDLADGDGVLDSYVDGPPWLGWADRPHLRVSIGEFVTTSFALVVTAAPKGSGAAG